MDLIGKNFFEGLGAKVLLGVPLSFEADFVVHGDYVGQFFFDLDGKRNWDSLCRLNKKFEQINLVNFLKPISFLKFPIDIIVVKHPPLAEKLRRYTAARLVKK